MPSSLTANHAFLRRPDPASSLLVYTAPPYAAQLLTCAWPDDGDALRRHLHKHGYAAVYVLSGMRDGRPAMRVGEGSVLWDRLRKHRPDPALAFATTIHLVCSPHYNKSTVLYLQAHLTDVAEAHGHTAVVAGIGPARIDTLHTMTGVAAHEAEVAVALLAIGGCPAFQPPRPAPDRHAGAPR